MIINNNALKIIEKLDSDNCYIISDFDKTITSEKSKNTWSVLSKSNKTPIGFIEERRNLYEKYGPIELDEELDYKEKYDLMNEWFKKCIELFSKYKISKNLFDKIALDPQIMDFRKGAQDFIKFLANKSIPLIIVSAGIGNFIESFLKNNNCLFDNSYIFSNKIVFKDGISIGVENDIIHSLNKSEISMPLDIQKKISEKNTVILLGDQISDSKVVGSDINNQVLKIGFYPKNSNVDINLYIDNFDIVCNEKDDYNDLLDLLFNK